MDFPFADEEAVDGMWSSTILPSMESIISQNSPPGRELEAIVLHKPRGSKGVWRPIGDDERLRTTKDKGKRLKVEIHLPPQTRPSGQISLSLINSAGQTITEGYSVESIKAFDNLVEMEVKVFLLSKGFRVAITIPTSNGDSAVALSKELTTHNSGARHGREEHQDHTEKKRKQEHPSPNHPGLAMMDAHSSSPDTSPHQSSSPPLEMQPIQTVQTVLLPPTRVPSTTSTASSMPSSMPSLAPNPPSMMPPPSNPIPQLHLPSMMPCDGPTNQIPMGSPGSPYATYIDGDLDVEGTVRARAFYQLSDIRLKTNIDDLADAMGIVSQLGAKTYFWRKGESESGGRRVIGMIAQEVQRVLPEVVYEDPHTGLLSVSYVEILPVLVEAYKQFLEQYKLQQEDIHAQIMGIEDKVEHITNIVGQRETQKEELDMVTKMMASVADTSRDFLDNYGSRRGSRDSFVHAHAHGKMHRRSHRRMDKITVPAFTLWIFLILGVSAVTIGFIIAITNLPQEISDDRDTDPSPSTTTTTTVVHFPVLFVIGTSLCVAGVISAFFAGAGLCIQKYTPKLLIDGTDAHPLMQQTA